MTGKLKQPGGSADEHPVRSWGVAVAAACALALCSQIVCPAATAQSAPGSAPIGSLTAQLEAATRAAEEAANDVYAQAANSADLTTRLNLLAEQRAGARRELAAKVRQIYMYGQPDPISALLNGLANPDFVSLRLGQDKSVRSDSEVMADLAAQRDQLAALQVESEQLRRSLAAAAEPVYAAQDRARALLRAARATHTVDEGTLAEWVYRLGQVANQVALQVTPTVTQRGRLAAQAEEPVIRELEAAGTAMPAGYRATGITLSGIASWYGPGFVGSPTSTGSPYDPERLTAAMLAVPLGTVVRVSSTDGHAVNVLVNDHGPYGKGRIIDLSHLAATMMGFSGLKQVTVEVLERA